MIKLKMNRKQGSESFDQGEPEVTVGSALELLCRFELAFGCIVIEAGKDKLHVRTYVLNCIDDVIFTGPANEIKYMVDACFIHKLITTKNKDLIVDKCVLHANGSPLLLTATGPNPNEILSGIPYSKIAALISVMNEKATDAIIKRLKCEKDEDFYAFLTMYLEDESALELLDLKE